MVPQSRRLISGPRPWNYAWGVRTASPDVDGHNSETDAPRPGTCLGVDAIKRKQIRTADQVIKIGATTTSTTAATEVSATAVSVEATVSASSAVV